MVSPFCFDPSGGRLLSSETEITLQGLELSEGLARQRVFLFPRVFY
jgi:hypothetical protein